MDFPGNWQKAKEPSCEISPKGLVKGSPVEGTEWKKGSPSPPVAEEKEVDHNFRV